MCLKQSVNIQNLVYILADYIQICYELNKAVKAASSLKEFKDECKVRFFLNEVKGKSTNSKCKKQMIYKNFHGCNAMTGKAKAVSYRNSFKQQREKKKTFSAKVFLVPKNGKKSKKNCVMNIPCVDYINNCSSVTTVSSLWTDVITMLRQIVALRISRVFSYGFSTSFSYVVMLESDGKDCGLQN